MGEESLLRRDRGPLIGHSRDSFAFQLNRLVLDRQQYAR